MKMTNKSNDPEIRCPSRGTKIINGIYWLMGVCALIWSKTLKGLKSIKECIENWRDSNDVRLASLLIILVILCGMEVRRSPKACIGTTMPCKISVVSGETDKVDTGDENVISHSVEKDETVRVQQEESTTTTLKTNEEIADEVILGLWGNGDERIKRLEEAGYNVQEIQKLVQEKMPVVTPALVATNGTGVLTKSGGISYNNPYGYKETWYSQKVLPGKGLTIPGRHVDERGLVCDGDGYICVAINVNDSKFPYGSIMETSLGLAKVYDHGCAPGVIDVYVAW